MRSSTARFILFLLIMVVFIVLGQAFDLDAASLKERLVNYPLVLSGLIFLLLYVGLTSFCWVGPKDVLRIASALIYGPMVSTLFVWLGELGNATVMFHMSRFFGRGFVEEKFGRRQKEKESSVFLRYISGSSVLNITALRINDIKLL